MLMQILTIFYIQIIKELYKIHPNLGQTTKAPLLEMFHLKGKLLTIFSVKKANKVSQS
jgi:hypothetical protein